MKQDQSSFSPEELKALIEKDKAERKQRAIAAIDEVLKKEHCSMSPVVILAAGNIVGRVDIVPLD